MTFIDLSTESLGCISQREDNLCDRRQHNWALYGVKLMPAHSLVPPASWGRQRASTDWQDWQCLLLWIQFLFSVIAMHGMGKIRVM